MFELSTGGEISTACIFCAQRAKDGLKAPGGRVCGRCVERIATLIRQGGEFVAACWGVEKRAISASEQMQQLIHDELRGSSPQSSDVPYVERAQSLLERGQTPDALEELAMALISNPSEKNAEAALGLLLGQLLRPTGGDVLRARLFGT